jgi:hypothetical protein
MDQWTKLRRECGKQNAPTGREHITLLQTVAELTTHPPSAQLIGAIMFEYLAMTHRLDTTSKTRLLDDPHTYRIASILRCAAGLIQNPSDSLARQKFVFELTELHKELDLQTTLFLTTSRYVESTKTGSV